MLIIKMIVGSQLEPSDIWNTRLGVLPFNVPSGCVNSPDESAIQNFAKKKVATK
jgi:hypothetical protein